MKEDLDVLFNAEEMADIININGSEITCFLYENKKNPSKNDQFGVYKVKKVLLLKNEDYELLNSPSYGYVINIDNVNFTVKEVDNQGSVIKLSLEGEKI